MQLRARNATPADYPRFTAAWAELAIDQSPPEEASWNANLRDRCFFLEDEAGATAAYAMCKAFREHGDVRQIVVMPGFRRRGVGRELMRHVRARLAAQGAAHWHLEVRADNAPALALYRSVGMAPEGREDVWRATPAQLATLAAAPGIAAQALRVREVEPADDDAIERAFGLAPELLTSLRRRAPDRPLVRADDAAGRARAIGRYLPDLGPALDVIWPLRAHDAHAAAWLIGALLPPARPDGQRVDLSSRDPGGTAALAPLLAAAGAHCHERIALFGGPLPAAL